MDNQQLLDKIDSIEDLPLSEEVLGAFAEGNLDEGEYAGVLNLIEYDDDTASLYNEIMPPTEEVFFPEDDEWNMADGLDSVENSENMSIEISSFDDDFNLDHSDDSGFSSELMDSFSLPDIEEYTLNNGGDGFESSVTEEPTFSWISGIGDDNLESDIYFNDSLESLDTAVYEEDDSSYSLEDFNEHNSNEDYGSVDFLTGADGTQDLF